MLFDERAARDPAPEPRVGKIAVLRANALGDFVVTLPALEALRAAYPEAEIVLLAREWHAAFLRGRPGPVDRVVAIPDARGVSVEPDAAEDPEALDAFFAGMSRERFDLAVQLHGGGRYSNPFVRTLGARLTIGLKTPDAAPLDRWIPYAFFQHEILRYLEVVSLVGAPPVALEPRLTVTAADRAEAARIVPDDGRPLVALHPGAGDPRRRWPPERFARVGDALAAAGARVVVTGIAAERNLVVAVVAAMRAEACNTCGLLSLSGLAGLLSRCRLAVSNDSGPLHVARAVGAATVGIYWCSNVMTFGPLTRARHRPAISWRMACPTCGRDCVYDPCTHRPSFVADVPLDEVTTAALDLLGSKPGG
jgi:ADP-heptose:LPS heptosyltransferase